ncbi:MAG: hypothetical protein ACK4UO_12995 [Pseudolabrys sp.]
MKGNAVIGIVGLAITITLALTGYFVKSTSALAEQVRSVEVTNATQDANIINLKGDVTEIKGDVKAILKAVK